MKKGISKAINAIAIIPELFSNQQHRKIKQNVRKETQSIFSIVRAKVQKFITQTSQNLDAELTPFNFMFEAQAIGIKIQYNTTALGTIN